MSEELKLNINLKTPDTQKAERVAQAKEKKKQAQYQPTWEEVWYTGYGNSKKGIFQTKVSDVDKERLKEVKMAIDSGEIGMHVESLKKFSKAHALNLYKMLMEQRKEQIIADMIAHKPANYLLINDKTSFEKLIADLDNEEETGLDTETNGLDYDLNHIVGISITLPKADYHVYIPVRHEIALIKQLAPDYVFSGLKSYLQNTGIGKVLHNAIFDMHMFYREGIFVKGILMDTLHAVKVLNENEESYALKNLATKYGRFFGFEDKSHTYEELFGKGGFEKTPLDIGTVYACKDTHLCYQFYRWLLTQFDRLDRLKEIYFGIELPNLYVSFEMERRGMAVDVSFAKDYTETLRKEVQMLEVQLQEVFGGININSNDQLAKVIYDDWGLQGLSKSRSVDADNIRFMADDNDDLKLLLKYRELNKLLTTYFEALPNRIWTRDGRLHGQFKQLGTATGRYSSAEPNLQNIPPEARPLVEAPKKKVIMGKDLSQIEPRCLAFMSGDKEFQDPYLTGKDLYSSLAVKVFHLPMENCVDGAYDPTHTFKPRKRTKTGLLATMYGTSNYTLAKQLEISVDEAEQFIEDFLNSYPTTKAYIQSIKDFVDENEYVETFLGRKRRFKGHKQIAVRYKAVCKKIIEILGEVPKDIFHSKLPYALKREYWDTAKFYHRVHRQAVNAVIQGSSADYIKQVMLRVEQYLQTLGDDYFLIGTIHDEILMEVPDDIPAEVIAELDRIMTGIEWFEFPVKTDTVVMYKWGYEIPVKEWMANREEYNERRTA